MLIIETETETQPPDQIWKQDGFDNFCSSPASGRSGGICAMWKSYQLYNETLELSHQEDRIIILKYKNLVTNYVLALCLVYAPPQETNKTIFWEHLSRIIQGLQIPIIIIGDLNEIQSADEKKGGSCPNPTRFQRLIQFKNECDLSDIPTIGNKFTWRKNTTEIDNTYEKLDRVLVSNQILQWFLNIATKNYVFTSSDHCMITIELSNGSMIHAQPFKFEQM